MLEDKMLTVEEVANLLRTTPNTVYRWLRSGRLEGIKIGKEWRISETALRERFNRKAISAEPVYFEKLNLQNNHVLAVAADCHNIYDLEAKFLREGLEKGYRLFKGCWWQTPDEVREEFSLRGIAVEALERENALVIVDLKEEYLKGGVAKSVEAWAEEAKKTQKLGYKKMWGSGSPCLFAGNNSTVVITFESLLEETLHKLPVVGICPYALDTFKDNFVLLLNLLNHHRGLFFYDQGVATYLKR